MICLLCCLVLKFIQYFKKWPEIASCHSSKKFISEYCFLLKHRAGNMRPSDFGMDRRNQNFLHRMKCSQMITSPILKIRIWKTNGLFLTTHIYSIKMCSNEANNRFSYNNNISISINISI